MEEKIFVGFGFGRFDTGKGQMQEYCNVFVLEDFYGTENEDYHFGGQKAVKYKCLKPDIFKDIPVGSCVYCSFDSRGAVSFMQIIDKK